MPEQPRPLRLPRRALLGSAAAALASCAGPRGHRNKGRDAKQSARLLDGCSSVLFQGDSITDAGRSRERAAEANVQAPMGSGYAAMAAATLLSASGGEELSIHNRGVSGNKVFQLNDRWEEDCLALQPDLLSILIGVNDIWHARNGNYDGTVEVYERDYDALLARTKQALPDVRLVVCEPFVLRCGAVDESWFPEFDEYRAAAKRVAEAHRAAWVPFHERFERALSFAPAEYWAGDGVHPTAAGAALMADAWLEVVTVRPARARS